MTNYTEKILGTFSSYEELEAFYPIEESLPEESLVQMDISPTTPITADQLEQLEQDLIAAGVPKWPGNTSIAVASSDGTTVRLCWVKGFPWTLIIIGLLIAAIPAILGGVLIAFLPEGFFDMIVMIIMMFIMMKMMGGMMGAVESKPKRVRAVESEREED